MSAVFATTYGDPVVGIAALLSLGLVLFLARDSFRQLLVQRRQRRVRQRQRRQFWGYD